MVKLVIEGDFGLDPTGVVGCGICLFFCVVAVIAFIFFRPHTEPFMIKQHLTLALGFTQIALLVSVAAYRKEEGCQAMSVILHYVITSCFSWCLLDSLYIYFNHTNSSHPIRKKVYYLVFGWGLPFIVLIMSLTTGFTLQKTKQVLSLYYCWPSYHITWTLVVPCLLTAMFNLIILFATLHNLRRPSYDICTRAVLERKSTRYCLWTNSILLLSLCIGWLFGMLSFYIGVGDFPYQLAFGLINGLQGLFLFFFHCVLNNDIRGYNQPGVHRCSHEDGCLTDRECSKRRRAHGQDPLVESRRMMGSRSQPRENFPPIGAQNTIQTENPSRSQSNELKGNERPTEVPWAVKNEPRPADQKRTTNERRATKPDHEAYPSLPGTPEPYISEFENVTKQPKRKSPPPDLTTEKPQKENEGLTKSETVTTLNSHNKKISPVDDIENKPNTNSSQAEHLRVIQVNEKSNSAGAIPPLPERKAERNLNSSHLDSRKLSVQSSASTGSTERKPRKTSRTSQGVSLNELESLFSNQVYMKPQRPSVSSLYSSGSGRESRKISAETVHAPGSRPSSRQTEETML